MKNFNPRTPANLHSDNCNEEEETSIYDDFDDQPSYSRYGGAHGYDDDTIDNAFEGDPEMYWNID